MLEPACLAATPGFPDFEPSGFLLGLDFAAVLLKESLLIPATTEEYSGSTITSPDLPPAWDFGVPAFDTICTGPLSAPCTVRGGSENTDILEASGLLGLTS
jgi:hypothetical protein